MFEKAMARSLRKTLAVYTLAWAGTLSGGEIVNIGDGDDGNLVVPAGQTVTWGQATGAVSTPLEMPTQAGQDQIAVDSTARFNPGNEILLYVNQANDATGAAGQYQTFNITSVQGEPFPDPEPGAVGHLRHEPGSGDGPTRAQLQQCYHQRQACRGALEWDQWRHRFLPRQGTLDITGTMTASGAGFAGASPGGVGQSYSLNGTGGGGAGNWEYGGGGASLNPDSTFQHLLLGSGGAGGDTSGGGGNGGGLIYAAADTIALTGEIDDSGGNARSWSYSNNGGGGSGGEVWLQCWDALDMFSGTINRSGGAGGPGGLLAGIYCWPGGGRSGLSRLDFHYGPVPYQWRRRDRDG